VLNELISNSIKHAVPGAKNPEIRIALKNEDGDCLSLGVSDNGPGLPDGFDFHSSNTMGALMVVSIVEHQLQGQFSVESGNGLSCRIQFRNKLGEERI
jgi:two-component sensor histidine kinase